MILPSVEEHADRTLRADEFLDQLTRMTPKIGGVRARPTIIASRWLTRYHLHRRGVTSYRRGRCLVAGDAAHIHSPLGAWHEPGIQDAYNLG